VKKTLHQDVPQPALDAQGPGGVQGHLGTIGRAEAALGTGQGQEVLGQRVGVLVLTLAVPGDAGNHRPLGVGVVAVLDRDGADRVQRRRVELEAVPVG
jgi:hypothetical protein